MYCTVQLGGKLSRPQTCIRHACMLMLRIYNKGSSYVCLYIAPIFQTHKGCRYNLPNVRSFSAPKSFIWWGLCNLMPYTVCTLFTQDKKRKKILGRNNFPPCTVYRAINAWDMSTDGPPLTLWDGKIGSTICEGTDRAKKCTKPVLYDMYSNQDECLI